MRTHISVLGVLHIVLGILGLIAALALLILFGGIASIVSMQDVPESEIAVPVLGTLGVGLFLFIAALSLPGLIVGWGLLKLRGWARVGGLVVSILELFNVPFGTALGVYGLVVLLSRETEPLFAAGPALN